MNFHFLPSKYAYFFLLLLVFALVSCEKEITIDLPEPTPKLVVEGFIEKGQIPYVLLTKNSSYFDPFDFEALENNFVHDANVTVSNGSDTIQLVEYCCSILPDSIKAVLLAQLGFEGTTCPFEICVYTINVFDPNGMMIGEIGKTYTLNASSGDLSVSAKSYMTNTVPIDSLWVEYNVVTTNDSMVRMMSRLSDPDTLGNYYMYYTRANSESFVYGGVFDDNVVNGKTFDSPIFKAIPRGADFDPETSGFYRKGDTMNIKWCTIDFATYNYYNTLDFELGSQGSIFASPTIIQSNVEGGLGVWAAINPSYHQTIALP